MTLKTLQVKYRGTHPNIAKAIYETATTNKKLLLRTVRKNACSRYSQTKNYNYKMFSLVCGSQKENSQFELTTGILELGRLAEQERDRLVNEQQGKVRQNTSTFSQHSGVTIAYRDVFCAVGGIGKEADRLKIQRRDKKTESPFPQFDQLVLLEHCIAPNTNVPVRCGNQIKQFKKTDSNYVVYNAS